jgi:pimeloyl-ACP methyl ester carboxylesterase
VAQFATHVSDYELHLPDGRKLCYAQYGAPAGTRVMYFHGSPACRLEPLLIGDNVLRDAGLCVVAADRPGVGGSDFQPGRGFSDWPQDVICLSDHLGWKRFSVLGNSGGAPYAAVCAARIPERVDQVAIVSGGWRMDWPEARQHLLLPNRLTLSLARRAPWLLGWMLKAMTSGAMGSKEKELAQMRSHLAPADYAAFAVDDRIHVLGRMLREAVRQGPRGAVWDLGLYGRTFDFELSAVQKTLHLFHGETDRNASLPLVRKVASLLPNAHLTIFPGEAHLSTLVNHFNAIAERL